ncbi:SDR family oxidoreductase [Nocardioides yefusunii]|uniref:SDR family oxidoreductase n=1 Tax=Nocardioides yefusunii TaxID=2500546 RepID=A0ABW1QZJ6_9ACTN|nr:SDR family oxidoreductase [Nocardioides yefusunii]
MTPRIHVLTGAGAGIGRALAAMLLSRGDTVVTVARSAARADEVRADLADAGPGELVVEVADLGDVAQVERLGAEIAQAHPRIDSLVHCAGVVELGRVADLDTASWLSQLNVNLTAPALLCRDLMTNLRLAHATVVMVNSGAGRVANPDWAGYAASKHGLRALADALRAEEAGTGVRVTSVYPSRTATDMQAKVHLQEGRPYRAADWMQPSSVAASVLHVLDLPVDATIPDLTIRTST